MSIWAFVSFMRTARPLGLDCPRCGGRLRRFAARAPGPGADYSASPPSSTGSPPADTSKAWASPNRARESPPAAQRPSAASRCPTTRPGRYHRRLHCPHLRHGVGAGLPSRPPGSKLGRTPPGSPPRDRVAECILCLLPSAHRRGHWRSRRSRRRRGLALVHARRQGRGFTSPARDRARPAPGAWTVVRPTSSRGGFNEAYGSDTR